MRLSHVNVSMPKGGETAAREFYAGLIGLVEITKPESIRGRGGVWFDRADSTCICQSKTREPARTFSGTSVWNVKTWMICENAFMRRV